MHHSRGTVRSSRLYDRPGDLHAIINVLKATRRPDRIGDYPGIGDMCELLCQPALQARTRLWFDREARCVAFSLVDTSNCLHFEIAPGAESLDLESQICSWGQDTLRQVYQYAESVAIQSSCRDDDSKRMTLLGRHGFIRRSIQTKRLTRSLLLALPVPVPPIGYKIRTVAGEADAEKIVMLHQLASGSELITMEGRLAFMHAADYDPDLDLVVVASDGKIVAFCCGCIHPEENSISTLGEGHIVALATEPEYQKIGLAKSLLLALHIALQSRDCKSAVLSVNGDNSPMIHLAESVGYGVESVRLWYSMPVPLG